MDHDASLLLPGSDDDEGPRFSIRKIGIGILLVALIVPLICFVFYGCFVTLESIGRLKFSMEPVANKGLGFAADESPASPSFNVTLRAKSTYVWVRFCSIGRARMEVTYSGVPIAVADVEPFCVDAGGETVITATVSSGWPVLPDVFQERMQSDRRHGGAVPIQVDFSFRNEDHAHPDKETAWWMRCPTMLDTDVTSSCKSYVDVGCCAN